MQDTLPWVEHITHRLGLSELAHLRRSGRQAFSPSLSYGRHFGPPRRASKAAAVMMMLEPISSSSRATTEVAGYAIPLTVRPMHLPDHPGQVSLPGGRLEGNETYQQAAEREFCEELGLREFPGQVIGELSPLYVYNSDYFVRAFVATCPEPLVFKPCDYEVQEVVRLPLATLLDVDSYSAESFSHGNVHWHANTILAGNTTIWGATAIMLAELATVIGTTGDGQETEAC